MKPVNSDSNLNQNKNLKREEDRFAHGFAREGRNPPAEAPLSTDPDLAHLFAVWPILPDHIKAAIMALVRAEQ
jgi:hypothetical protein